MQCGQHGQASASQAHEASNTAVANEEGDIALTRAWGARGGEALSRTLGERNQVA